MKNLYDLIIIGAGPAGLSAGLYAGRAKLKTLIIDVSSGGGQIAITSEVVNYPGVLHASGRELTDIMKKQATQFGAKILQAQIFSVSLDSTLKKVLTSEGEFEAVSVILATGAKPRSLGFEGEDKFHGRGIGNCATCDGEFFTDMDIFVIGGGFAAAEEAIYLTRFGKMVHIIVREDYFTCDESICQNVFANDKIKVYFNTEIVKVEGDEVIERATFVNNKTGEQWTHEVQKPDMTFGVFVFVGYEPMNELFADQITLNMHGYVLTDEDLKTNIHGIYAAGDIRPKKLRQLVTAVSDGAIAATSAGKYIDKTKKELNLVIADEKETSSTVQSFIDENLKAQLSPILSRLEKELTLVVVAEDDDLSKEMTVFAREFANLSDQVSLEITPDDRKEERQRMIGSSLRPSLAIFNRDGSYTGIVYHGVPSGHEFNSFVLAIYNASGPGQSIDAGKVNQIKSIDKPVNIKVGVSLSCTMCPDVVQASQILALYNNHIQMEMIDISKFPEFKNQYKIMSVPAIVINDADLLFGKKSLDDMIEILTKNS